MKPQIHASHLEMFFRCPTQYEFRHVLGIIIPPGSAAITGTGTHGAISPNMQALIDTGELLPLEQVQDIARDATNEAWDKQGVRLIPEEAARGEAIVRGESVDMAVKLSTLHHLDIAPSLDPAATEEAWVLEMPGFPHDLAGRMDLREKSGRIRDTKTRSKKPTQSEADQMGQLTVYALAGLKIFGAMPALTVDYLIKSKNPVAVSQSTTRTNADFQKLFRKLEVMERALEAGVFLPAAPGVWWCGPKWCGYWERCRYGKGA